MPSTNRSQQPQASAATGVAIAREGDVLTFTLQNAGQGNQVTGAMFDAMLAELRAQSRQPSARVLRIRAQGKVFCIGRERAGRNRQQIRRESARVIDFKAAVRTSHLITIAEVQGDALGFGFGLAIVSDFVIVAENAILGFPEMHSGLAPSAIMAYLGEYTLPRWAFPLVLFGETITPHHALEIGLISQVCAPERLIAEADSLVERILKLDPVATRRCKEFFLTAQQNSFARNCRLATDALTAGSLPVLARQT